MSQGLFDFLGEVGEVVVSGFAVDCAALCFRDKSVVIEKFREAAV